MAPPVAWLFTTFLRFQEWRTGRTVYRPEDPPFTLPPQPVVHHNQTSSTDDTDPYSSRRRDTATEEDEDEDEGRSPFADEVAHNTAYNTGLGGGPGVPGGRYAGYGNAPGRPSMDAYGAFSDPNPSGYGGYGGYGGGGRQPEISRTMQYADPYAAVQASIHSNTPPPGLPQSPVYGGYRR